MWRRTKKNPKNKFPYRELRDSKDFVPVLIISVGFKNNSHFYFGNMDGESLSYCENCAQASTRLEIGIIYWVAWNANFFFSFSGQHFTSLHTTNSLSPLRPAPRRRRSWSRGRCTSSTGASPATAARLQLHAQTRRASSRHPPRSRTARQSDVDI